MKNTGKMLSVLTGIVLSIGLVACGGRNSGATSADAKVTLKWYGYQSAGEDNQKVLDEVSGYVSGKINAAIDFVMTEEATFDQTISIVLASGENIDLVWGSNNRNDIFRNVAKGAFIPIDDLLDKYAPDIKKTIPDYVWEALSVKNQIYGVPNYDRYTMAPSLLLNKNIVDKYNFDMSQVKSIFDLEPLFDMIVKDNPKLVCVDGSQGFFFSFPVSAVFDRFDKYSTIGVDLDSTKVSAEILCDRGVELLKTAKRWNNKGFFDPDVISVVNNAGDIRSGRIVGYWTMVDYPGSGTLQSQRSYGFESYEVPCYDRPKVATNTCLGNVTSISVASKNPDRAMMAMNQIFTDPYLQNLLAYGIEGQNYTRNANGSITLDSNKKYFLPSVLTNISIQDRLDIYPEDRVAKIIKANESGHASVATGFNYDSTTTADKLAACKSVWNEYFVAMACGVLSYENDYPKFLQKLEQAGFKDIMSDVQKQLDAWAVAKGKRL